MRLPSLTSLRAFEAAARLGSFKRAAEELSVTPAAISQQIRALEDDLGEELFRRAGRNLALTDIGSAYAPGLADGFARILEATANARAGMQPRSPLARINAGVIRIRLAEHALARLPPPLP